MQIEINAEINHPHIILYLQKTQFILCRNFLCSVNCENSKNSLQFSLFYTKPKINFGIVKFPTDKRINTNLMSILLFFIFLSKVLIRFNCMYSLMCVRKLYIYLNFIEIKVRDTTTLLLGSPILTNLYLCEIVFLWVFASEY